MVDVATAGSRIEVLLDEITTADARVADKAEDLVRVVTTLYGDALARMVDLLTAEQMRRVMADDLLAGLLVLHDLHPDDVATRVKAALDAVRPALGAHSGGVELLGIDEDADGVPGAVVVRLRLEGSCHGCPSSMVTVHQAIERAVLAAAPEVARVEVEGTAEPARAPALLQIQPLRTYAEDGSECPAVVGAG